MEILKESDFKEVLREISDPKNGFTPEELKDQELCVKDILSPIEKKDSNNSSEIKKSKNSSEKLFE